MDKRYQDPDVSSFLDPRFKSLAHLPASPQEETVDSVIDELTQTLHMAAQPVYSSTEQEVLLLRKENLSGETSG